MFILFFWHRGSYLQASIEHKCIQSSVLAGWLRAACGIVLSTASMGTDSSNSGRDLFKLNFYSLGAGRAIQALPHVIPIHSSKYFAGTFGKEWQNGRRRLDYSLTQIEIRAGASQHSHGTSLTHKGTEQLHPHGSSFQLHQHHLGSEQEKQNREV